MKTLLSRRRFLSVAVVACMSLAHPAYVLGANPAGLSLASVSAVIVPLGANQPIYSKHADIQMPIASLTKLMTALVVMQSGQSLDERLTLVPYRDNSGKNTYSRLRSGAQISRRNLLHMALMSSENMATYVLAHYYPGGVDAFISRMNATAQSLGMVKTHFVDPSGLSPSNVSSANDLVKLASATYQYSEIRRLSTIGQADMHFVNPSHALSYTNTNPLVRNANWQVHLSKTGYIEEAGRCLLMVANIKGKLTTLVFLDSHGLRTPIGDAGRVRRWLESGESGTVPDSALVYQRERLRRLSVI